MSSTRQTGTLTSGDSYFEDFPAGRKIRHARGTTIGEVESQLLTKLVMNSAQAHWNEDAAAKSPFGRRIVFGLITASCVVGLASQDTAENSLAELSMTGLRFRRPVHLGDTLYTFTEVLDTRVADRDDSGIVRFRHWGVNQNREVVFAELEGELEKDRARSQALSLSEFGLVEITRKRSRANLERVLTVSCPDCRGRGRIKSVVTVCLELRRQLLGSLGHLAGQEVLLQTHPVIEEALRTGSETDVLIEMEQALGRKLVIRSDASLDRDAFELEVL